MVLLYLGLDMPEARLARLLGTRAFGTPVRRMMRLESLGVQATIGAYSETMLRLWLRQRIPPNRFSANGCAGLLDDGNLPCSRLGGYDRRLGVPE